MNRLGLISAMLVALVSALPARAQGSRDEAAIRAIVAE